MLPGLRFLFAATLMCISVLVFGMGAIALMRASHQQFASAPPRLPPEPVFAQAPQTMPAAPTLSMLRIEPAPPPPALGEIAQQNRVAGLTETDRGLQPSSVLPGETASDTEARPDDQRGAAAAPAIPEASPLAQAATEPSAPLPSDEAGAPSTEMSAAAPEPVPAPEVTGSVAAKEDTPPLPEATPPSAPPVIDPPLPVTRPQLAALPPAAEAVKKPIARPIVKRKVRKVKREPPKKERLPAVTSAPTLGSLFGGGN